MTEDKVVSTDRAGRIETHGADYVPESERHGSPRSLFAVWAGSNIVYLYFVLGGLMVLLGLNIWQSIAAILAGNLIWIAVGYLAVSGPSSGSPSETVSRAFFGVNGNRIVQITSGWLVGVLYEAINLSIGALAGVALVEHTFRSASPFVQGSIVVGLAVATFTISVYGHATIVKLAPWFTWSLLAALVILAFFVLVHANFEYVPKGGTLSGPTLWGVAAAGFAIIASAPLSWGVGADYSRYLPTRTSPKATAFWTGFGGFLPSTSIAVLGVLAGTAVNMTDPETSMAKIMPAWFYVIFLLVIVVGSVSNNAMTAYSSGLALLATGIPWRRSITIIFDAVVAISVTLYALFISNFLDTLSGLLQVSIAVLTPTMTIYVIDITLRHNRYDGPSLQETSRHSLYWYRGGFNVGGFGGLLAGTAAALLCVNTTFYVGPVARALGGADISVFVGAIVGGAVYTLVENRRIRATVAARTSIGPETMTIAGKTEARPVCAAVPTVTDWFHVEHITPTIARIDEPHVHELLRANVWHVQGAERDLVVDAGLGVASLRDNIPTLFSHDPILVLSHAHLDHVGSAYEFDDRRMHPASHVDERMPATLNGPELIELLGIRMPDIPRLLLDRMPRGFDPQQYQIPAAPPTTLLADGDVIDLGDRALRVLHVPGHTPGSICLFDSEDGALFSGDTLYDDTLLDDLHESNVNDYLHSMQRLRALPVRTVYPGHGTPFDGRRMRQIIDEYVATRTPLG